MEMEIENSCCLDPKEFEDDHECIPILFWLVSLVRGVAIAEPISTRTD